MPLDKAPFVIKEFKGRLRTDTDVVIGGSGADQTETPFNYAQESYNLNYLKKGGIRTRNGIERYVELLNVTGKPIQAWKIETLNGVTYVDRWLILTWDGVDGRLYDTQVAAPATNPILTLTNMKYAYVLNAFSRIYISPWSAFAVPLATGASPYVFVYNGAYNVRLAGGALPVLGAFAAAAAAGGNCTVGLHLASVLYESDSGFITNFPDTVGVAVTTTAANGTINFTNIPTGPTGIARRHIILTKVIVNNNGQGFLGYEPFIAVTINDNTTTTASFANPDSALVDSAKDYLFSHVRLLPCISLALYGNRLVYVGIGRVSNITNIAVSTINSPEQLFNDPRLVETQKGSSYISVGPDYPGFPMAGAEINGTFYIFKENSTFSIVSDDELDPTEWVEPTLVDASKGAYPFSIAKIGSNLGLLLDGNLLVGGKHGITYFNGVFAQKSIAEGTWNSFETADYKWLNLLVDADRQVILFRVGDPAEDNLTFPIPNKYVIIGDYYYGLDITKIRWGRYEFGEYPVGTQIIVAGLSLRSPGTSGNVGPAAKFNTFRPLYTILTRKLVAGTTYNIYILSEGILKQDFEVTTPAVYPSWGYTTGFTPNNNGEIYTFGPLVLRITTNGAGNVTVEKLLLDSDTSIMIGTFNPGATPGKYISLNVNEVGEHIRISMRGQNRSFIQTLILHAAERSKDKPRV